MWEPGLSRGATKELKKCNYLKIKYHFRTFISKLLGKTQSLLSFLRKLLRKTNNILALPYQLLQRRIEKLTLAEQISDKIRMASDVRCHSCYTSHIMSFVLCKL